MLPSQTFAWMWQSEETAPKFENILYQKTGKDSNGVTGQFSTVKDSDGTECFNIGNTVGVKQLIYNIGDELSADTADRNDEGVCMISFDICPQQTDKAIVLIVQNADGSGYAPFMFNGRGKVLWNQSRYYPSATSMTDDAVPYEANKWYNVKVVFYTHESYMDFYIDDVYCFRNDIANAYFMSDLYGDSGQRIDKIFFNYYGNWALDEDGNVLPGDASGGYLINNFTYGTPEKRSEELAFWRNEVGNIYDCEDVNVGLDLTNRTSEDKTYTLKYDIRTDKNKRVKTDSTTVEVKSGETKGVTLLTDAPEHGFYTVEAELYNQKGEIVIRNATRFSVISHQDGVNEKVGACIHNIGHGDSTYGSIADTFDVVEKLGISSVRDDYGMAKYSAEGTTLISGGEIERSNRLSEETNVDRLVIVRCTTDAYNMVYDENSEEVKTFLKNWGNFCYQLAMDTGDAIYYEIENEWFLHGTEGKSGVKYNLNISSDIQLYAEMYKIASKKIKEAKPEAKIVAFQGGHGTDAWSRAVLDALGENPGQYFDIWAMHDYLTYWNAQYPEQYMEHGDPTRTSEAGGWDKFKKLLEDYNLTDKPIWSTEFGSTSGYHKWKLDEKINGDYYVRHLMFDTKYMERMYIYQLHNDRDPVSLYEGGFGISRSATKGDVPREALPAALEVAAYNTLLKGADFVSEQVIGTDGNINHSTDTYVYKFKTADRNDCYVFFNLTSEKTLSLDLGADKVSVYDEYGNETKVDAYDGYVTLNITTAPTYVIADSLKEEVTAKDAPLFDVTREVQSCVNDMFTFEVTNNTSSDIDIDVEESANTYVSSTSAKESGKTKVNVTTGNDVLDIENYKFYNDENLEEMVVTVKNSGKTYYRAPVRVKYVDSLESEFNIVPYRSGHWQAVLKLKNNKRTSPLSGKIDISTGDSDEIKNLLSGQQSTIRFNIPEDIDKSKSFTVSAVIYLDDNTTVTNEAETSFIALERTYSSPEIDGKIDSGEWVSGGGTIKFDNAEQYKKLDTTVDWKGKDDLSGKAYLMYDDDYFYLAVEVTDNIHCGDDAGKGAWAMDSVQFAVSERLESDSEYTEFGFALNDNGETVIEKYRDVESANPLFDSSAINDFDEGTEAKVVRNGNTTTYEIKIPWSELTVSKEKPKGSLNFSMLINENDKAGRAGFMEWASGIGQGKNPSKFGTVPFNN